MAKAKKAEGKAAVVRNPAVSAETKLRAYFQGRKNNQSMAEIAKSIGMKPSSFAVSISQLRKIAKATAAAKAEAGVEFTNPFDSLPKTRIVAGSVKSLFDNSELMKALDNLEVVEETPAGETVDA